MATSGLRRGVPVRDCGGLALASGKGCGASSVSACLWSWMSMRGFRRRLSSKNDEEDQEKKKLWSVRSGDQASSKSRVMIAAT